MTSMTPMTSHATCQTLFPRPAAAAASRSVMPAGAFVCEVRVRAVALIAEVLGFEDEMDVASGDLLGSEADRHGIADLLDSRLIAPPRPRGRRQRAVSSRAMFYGTTKQ